MRRRGKPRHLEDDLQAVAILIELDDASTLPVPAYKGTDGRSQSLLSWMMRRRNCKTTLLRLAFPTSQSLLSWMMRRRNGVTYTDETFRNLSQSLLSWMMRRRTPAGATRCGPSVGVAILIELDDASTLHRFEWQTHLPDLSQSLLSWMMRRRKYILTIALFIIAGSQSLLSWMMRRRTS